MSERAEAGGERPRSMLLADMVYDRVRRSILNGEFRPDERLPGENALAGQYEVSRPVIRAALKRLRDEGMVTSRQGSGSFVSAPVAQKPLAFQPLDRPPVPAPS